MSRFENAYYVSDERLEKYRPLFPLLFDEVKDAAKVIRKDEKALDRLGLLIDALFDAPEAEICITPEAGNIAENFAPIFALLAHIEKCEQEMEKRGFDEETTSGVLAVFENILKGHKKKFGFAACSQTIFFWSRHYLVPDIFRIGDLQFEIQKYADDEIYRLYNGEYLSVRNGSKKAGAVAGTKVLRGGADDAESKYIGYGGCVIQKGDYVISVHIPAGADISEEACERNYAAALAFFGKYYPECDIKAFICHSWLMDPELQTLLPESAKILSFQRYYHLVPAKSSGEEVMYFVFNKRPEKLEDLPENTTLTRNLKKRYMENDPIYAHIGVHLLKEYPEPKLLTSISGEKIRTKEQWEQFRRDECMELLTTYVYGRQPAGKPKDLTFTTNVKNADLDGLVFKEVTISFQGFSFAVKVYHKKDAKFLPTFLYFMHMKEQNTCFNEDEAETINAPIKDICNRGYAFIVMQYTSIYHDDFTCANFDASLFKPFSPPRAERADTDWGAIALWSWAASRVMDYIESEDTYDKNHVGVVGHSRGGKTALWTGATDPRFSFVVSNSSGCMGAAMLRDKKGEHLDFITVHTDWFCKNLDKFCENEALLPVDQHMLLACIAPRLLYVESNSLDEWSDPVSERRGARLAGAAYALYGLKGVVLPEDDNIECGKAYHEGRIGYHMSEGAHKIRAHDWEKFMTFWEKNRGV